MSMKTLIIDNYDSMTFNLFQLIGEINGTEPIVLRNDEAKWEDIASLDVDNIIISPGPGRPERETDFGVSKPTILKADVPILGVCLGHQGIGHVFGARVCHAPEPMHGRSSLISHTGEDLFEGIPSPISVVRYHSLILAEELPAALEKQAWTSDGIIMAIRHRSRPIWGVQFHPESICTRYGKQVLANFKRCTERHARTSRTRLGKPTARFNQVPAFTPPAVEPPSCRKIQFVLHSRQLDFIVDPECFFAAEFSRAQYAFWLDSSMVSPGLSRFSLMGDANGPYAEVLTYRSSEEALVVRRGNTTEICRESIFDYLRREVQQRSVQTDDLLPFDFTGGYIGYFGYELRQECGARSRHTSQTPDAAFVFADRYLIFDHAEGKIWLVYIAPPGSDGEARAWLDYMTVRLAKPVTEVALECGNAPEPVSFHLRHSRGAYIKRIEACLEELRNGESYEICLTNQVMTTIRPDPLTLYRILRKINPAPFAAFLRLPGVAVLSSSPERFLKIDRNHVLEAKPIKGTIPRGRTETEDLALREELRNSEKDRAENLMIVDLLRNDLGLVSEINSVHVPKLMDIESYATVHQMVSTIRSRLHASVSPIDAIRAAFPGGSMTGMPKLRTMEILDALEEGPRGVYSGALGFVALNGTVDLSIVIRTVVVDDGTVSIGCGGAIVTLSDPAKEFEEMMIKAQAPMRAVARTVTGRLDAFIVDGVEDGPMASDQVTAGASHAAINC
jgi:para-aminobenzoate synthetase